MFSYKIDPESLDIDIFYGEKRIDSIAHSLQNIDKIEEWAKSYVDKKIIQNREQ